MAFSGWSVARSKGLRDEQPSGPSLRGQALFDFLVFLAAAK